MPKLDGTLETLIKSQTDPEACPGCGCMPGDGRTPGCNDEDGCGFYADEQKKMTAPKLVNPEASERRMRNMLETLERAVKGANQQYRSSERKQLDIELEVIGKISDLLEDAKDIYEAAYCELTQKIEAEGR